MDRERLQGALRGCEHDRVDQTADRFGGLAARLGVLKCFGEPGHLLAIQVRHSGVEQRQRLAFVRELGLEGCLALLGGIPLDLQVRVSEPILDGLNHPADVVLDALELPFGSDAAGAVLHPEPVHLARELLAELLEQVLAQ